MYSWIIRSKLERTFAHINAGEYAPVVAAFAPDHEHVFHGDHALGGTRRTLESTRRWYARLARIFPDLTFEVRSIAVEGWPWRTHAVVEWRDTFTLPSGERGSNQGVHALEIAWGRVRRLEIYCDTARLSRYCTALANFGIAEAAAPPIVD